MKKLFVFAAGALAALALAGTAPAAGSTPKLLKKFQPVLVFHPDEEFRPTTVESFIRDSDLEAATSPTTWTVVNPSPTPDDLPTSSPPVWRLNQQPCFAGAPLGDLPCYVVGASDEPGVTVYGRVVKDGKSIVLQYWLFYYDNLYRYPFLPLGAIWQSHEGDWEVVNVVLTNQKRPVAVGLSEHCSGETRDWAETERRDGHPTVYVALGSHANYFEPGLHEFEQACLPAQVIAFFQQAGLPLARGRRRARALLPGRSASASSRPASRRSPKARRTGSPSRASGASSSTSALRRRSAPSPSGRRPSGPRSTRSGRSRSPRWTGGASRRTHGAARTGPPPRGAGAHRIHGLREDAAAARRPASRGLRWRHWTRSRTSSTPSRPRRSGSSRGAGRASWPPATTSGTH